MSFWFYPTRCGSDCTGSFRLRYKGQYATIQHGYDEEEVASKLMALTTIKVGEIEADNVKNVNHAPLVDAQRTMWQAIE